MGADLYIENLPDDTRRGGFEVSLEAVKSGYFRDAYNGCGLFAIMSRTLDEEFSWWQISDREDLFTRSDEDGLVMTAEGVKKWWSEMKPHIRKFIKRKTYYRAEYIPSDERKDPDDMWKKIRIHNQEDIKAIRGHAELFERFHTYAVELGSSVGWSV